MAKKRIQPVEGNQQARAACACPSGSTSLAHHQLIAMLDAIAFIARDPEELRTHSLETLCYMALGLAETGEAVE